MNEIEPSEAEIAFIKLFKLYNFADELENNGEDKDANEIRSTLDYVSKFILNQIPKL
jgi:hypothetical protein